MNEIQVYSREMGFSMTLTGLLLVNLKKKCLLTFSVPPKSNLRNLSMTFLLVYPLGNAMVFLRSCVSMEANPTNES